MIRLHCFSSMSFLLRCATTAHRVSFFKSASLFAAGFLRRRASSGLDFPSWRCLHLAFTGLLKANFYSLRFQPLRSQWGMCAHLGLLRDFHTDCTNAASKPPRHRPPARRWPSRRRCAAAGKPSARQAGPAHQSRRRVQGRPAAPGERHRTVYPPAHRRYRRGEPRLPPTTATTRTAPASSLTSGSLARPSPNNTSLAAADANRQTQIARPAASPDPP